MLHDDDGVDTQHMAGKRQTPQDIVGDPPTGVSNHVGLAQVQTERGEHVDAGVHAGHDCEAAARPGVGDVGACRRVPLVSGKEVGDLRHGGYSLASR